MELDVPAFATAYQQEQLNLTIFKWEPHEHPRNLLGRFVKKIVGMNDGATVTLPDGVTVSKENGKFRVGLGATKISTTYKKPESVAEKAFDMSAASTAGDSLGGGYYYSSHKFLTDSLTPDQFDTSKLIFNVELDDANDLRVYDLEDDKEILAKKLEDGQWEVTTADHNVGDVTSKETYEDAGQAHGAVTHIMNEWETIHQTEPEGMLDAPLTPSSDPPTEEDEDEIWEAAYEAFGDIDAIGYGKEDGLNSADIQISSGQTVFLREFGNGYWKAKWSKDGSDFETAAEGSPVAAINSAKKWLDKGIVPAEPEAEGMLDEPDDKKTLKSGPVTSLTPELTLTKELENLSMGDKALLRFQDDPSAGWHVTGGGMTGNGAELFMVSEAEFDGAELLGTSNPQPMYDADAVAKHLTADHDLEIIKEGDDPKSEPPEHPPVVEKDGFNVLTTLADQGEGHDTLRNPEKLEVGDFFHYDPEDGKEYAGWVTYDENTGHWAQLTDRETGKPKAIPLEKVDWKQVYRYEDQKAGKSEYDAALGKDQVEPVGKTDEEAKLLGEEWVAFKDQGVAPLEIKYALVKKMSLKDWDLNEDPYSEAMKLWANVEQSDKEPTHELVDAAGDAFAKKFGAMDNETMVQVEEEKLIDIVGDGISNIVIADGLVEFTNQEDDDHFIYKRNDSGTWDATWSNSESESQGVAHGPDVLELIEETSGGLWEAPDALGEQHDQKVAEAEGEAAASEIAQIGAVIKHKDDPLDEAFIGKVTHVNEDGTINVIVPDAEGSGLHEEHNVNPAEFKTSDIEPNDEIGELEPTGEYDDVSAKDLSETIEQNLQFEKLTSGSVEKVVGEPNMFTWKTEDGNWTLHKEEGYWHVEVEQKANVAWVEEADLAAALNAAGSGQWDNVNGHQVPAANESPQEVSQSVSEAFPSAEDWNFQANTNTYHWSSPDETGAMWEWTLQQATQGPTVLGWKVTMFDGSKHYESFGVTVDELLEEVKSGDWQSEDDS
jgi:hypothetical protein